jgi:hypothetical protein
MGRMSSYGVRPFMNATTGTSSTRSNLRRTGAVD